MKIAIFAGPTLDAAEIALEVDAVVLPPVARGDVLRVAGCSPRAIGIIDGYFDRIPAVWHKEILAAMQAGIWVFGAASMGALRAVELAPFGMVGVGKIFRAYQGGELTDDDEVAVAHGAAETKFRPLSEAMVNIRATIAAAERVGIVCAGTATKLIALAKGLHYPERSYPRVLEMGNDIGISQDELATLKGWLPIGAVNQKRLDALDMLRAMRQFADESPPPPVRVLYEFEHTETWEDMRMREAARDSFDAPLSDHELVEEVLISADCSALADAALARALSLRFSAQLGGSADGPAMVSACDEFRRELGLIRSVDFQRWLKAADIAAESIDDFFRDVGDVRRIRAMFRTEMKHHLPDCLREKGLYEKYVRRVGEKRRILSSLHCGSPSLEDLGLTEEEFWERYFHRIRGMNVPHDLPTYARANGFDDLRALRAAVARELFVQKFTGEPRV
jgi:hypothetical protein